MRLSLFVILLLSWTFFALYNFILMIGALVGFFPLTIFTGVYYTHITTEELMVLLGIPSAVMGLLSTFITRSRLWGFLNVLIASTLVIVEINFSLIAGYALARNFGAILEVFRRNYLVYVISGIFSLIKKRSLEEFRRQCTSFL